MSKGKGYTRERKIEAVKRSYRDDVTVKKVAEKLGVHPNTLSAWRSEFDEYGPDESFPGKGNQHSKDERIAELEDKVDRLEEEKAILKKASRIFVEEEQT
jgi:transposase